MKVTNTQNVMTVALVYAAIFMTTAAQADDSLPSWNDGPAKQAIVEFVNATTDQSSPKFVPAEARIATFDHETCGLFAYARARPYMGGPLGQTTLMSGLT